MILSRIASVSLGVLGMPECSLKQASVPATAIYKYHFLSDPRRKEIVVWMGGIKIEPGLHIYHPPTNIYMINQTLALCRDAFRKKVPL